MPRFYILFFAVIFSFSAFTQAEEVTHKQVVRFATEANYYPFEYLDAQGKMQGFDIEIAKAICEQMDFDCSFQNQRFDSLLLSLKFGRFDAVIAALDITSERLQDVDFSNSYYKVDPVFLRLADTEDIFSLNGKFIAVQAASSNQDYLTKFKPHDSFVIPYPTLINAFNALKDAQIDAIFGDRAVILTFLNKVKNNQDYILSEMSGPLLASFSSGYGIAIKKGNKTLQQQLNTGLSQIKENGIYLKIFKHYFKGENQR
ncbi:arginine ABC transporter solute-binding protein [Psychromonas sp. CNPT3]|uniref:transporter substrate-binding domain-containing protein n=1 Tax=Psychromonas sp. CNPT3 TaxID=314282 RepID=UPI00006E5827|nr:transporter substrate-binding domain-containing protein [Psychromonas sp. CNPT3]AGH80435.1 arginine ABC transporter solute-binding protein [Psychromonas sp. CNPT3]